MNPQAPADPLEIRVLMETHDVDRLPLHGQLVGWQMRADDPSSVTLRFEPTTITLQLVCRAIDHMGKFEAQILTCQPDRPWSPPLTAAFGLAAALTWDVPILLIHGHGCPVPAALVRAAARAWEWDGTPEHLEEIMAEVDLYVRHCAQAKLGNGPDQEAPEDRQP